MRRGHRINAVFIFPWNEEVFSFPACLVCAIYAVIQTSHWQKGSVCVTIRILRHNSCLWNKTFSHGVLQLKHATLSRRMQNMLWRFQEFTHWVSQCWPHRNICTTLSRVKFLEYWAQLLVSLTYNLPPDLWALLISLLPGHVNIWTSMTGDVLPLMMHVWIINGASVFIMKYFLIV